MELEATLRTERSLREKREEEMSELRLCAAALKEKLLIEHEKLLAARRDKNAAIKKAHWYKTRDQKLTPLKARTAEQREAVRAAQLAARDMVDGVVIDELQSRRDGCNAEDHSHDAAHHPDDVADILLLRRV